MERRIKEKDSTRRRKGAKVRKGENMDISQRITQFEALDLSDSGWVFVSDENGRDAFEQELRRELAPGHVLADKEIFVMGRKFGRDDILIVLADDENHYAGVHLTYRCESDPLWPYTWFYRDLQDFIDGELSGERKSDE